MVERYVGSELKEYRRIFRPSDEAGGLDNVGRRFAWFRRVLSRHEAEMENDKDGKRVFPDDWKVGWAMFAKFSEITREDFAVVLTKAAATLTVQQLLDTLQPTMEFEALMSRKWSASVCSGLEPRSSNVLRLIFMMHSLQNFWPVATQTIRGLLDRSHPSSNFTWAFLLTRRTGSAPRSMYLEAVR